MKGKSPVKSLVYSHHAVALLAIAALGLALALPAQAQFVCVGSATGATVPPAKSDGAGATAPGDAANVACGTNAKANGAGSGNSAFGINATAMGDGSINTATGNSANAGGNNSANTAVGASANASG